MESERSILSEAYHDGHERLHFIKYTHVPSFCHKFQIIGLRPAAHGMIRTLVRITAGFYLDAND